MAKKSKAEKKLMRGKPKTGVSFKTWATTLARARGEQAAAELAKFRKNAEKFATLADDKLARTFPKLAANFRTYQLRGSQAAA